MDFWTAKSKYGTTIQDALDWAMSADPKNENVLDIIPHVAAVAAAYGDPKGKYAAFLQKHQPDYAAQPFWYYDQAAALPHSPAGRAAAPHRRSTLADGMQSPIAVDVAAPQDAQPGDPQAGEEPTAPDAAAHTESGPIPFVCPTVFDTTKETELEDGLFVTCDELRPYYEITLPFDPDTGDTM